MFETLAIDLRYVRPEDLAIGYTVHWGSDPITRTFSVPYDVRITDFGVDIPRQDLRFSFVGAPVTILVQRRISYANRALAESLATYLGGFRV